MSALQRSRALAATIVLALAGCSSPPIPCGCPPIPLCGERIIAFVQQLYPIPGSTGAPRSGIVVYAQSIPEPMTVTLANGRSYIHGTFVNLPHPLPSPMATPDPGLSLLRAVSYRGLRASKTYDVTATAHKGVTAACPAVHQPIGRFRTR